MVLDVLLIMLVVSVLFKQQMRQLVSLNPTFLFKSRVPIMMVQMHGASMSTIFAAIVGAVGVVAFLQVMWTNNRASE